MARRRCCLKKQRQLVNADCKLVQELCANALVPQFSSVVEGNKEIKTYNNNASHLFELRRSAREASDA